MKTRNQWLKSNYLDVAAGKAEQFKVWWEPYPFVVQPFFAASEHAAAIIRHEFYGRDFYLALSGGADSEYIARLFHHMKIIFTPIIIKSDVNEEDVAGAVALCKELDLVPFVYTTTQREMVKYYTDIIYPNRNDGFTSVYQMLAVEKVKELGGVIILGETHIYDPDPNRSVVKAFKFLPDLIYSDVVPFYYYTIDLVYAEMSTAMFWSGDTPSLKAILRGTKWRDKIMSKYTDTKEFHIAARHLRSEWLYYDMGKPKDFIKYMEKFAI